MSQYVLAGMLDGVVEIGEHVSPVRDVAEGADGIEDFEMCRFHALEQHHDAATMEILDELPERVRAGGIEHLHPVESQDEHPDIGLCREVIEELLGNAEEQCAIHAEHCNVFM